MAGMAGAFSAVCVNLPFKLFNLSNSPSWFAKYKLSNVERDIKVNIK